MLFSVHRIHTTSIIHNNSTQMINRLPLAFVIRNALTNQKACLSTRHDSSKYGGAVLGGRASGQEAKDT